MGLQIHRNRYLRSFSDRPGIPRWSRTPVRSGVLDPDGRSQRRRDVAVLDRRARWSKASRRSGRCRRCRGPAQPAPVGYPQDQPEQPRRVMRIGHHAPHGLSPPCRFSFRVCSTLSPLLPILTSPVGRVSRRRNPTFRVSATPCPSSVCQTVGLRYANPTYVTLSPLFPISSERMEFFLYSLHFRFTTVRFSVRWERGRLFLPP